MKSSGGMGLECSLCRLYRIAVEAAKPRHGVRPGFTPWHVIAFMLMAWSGPVGRPTVSKMLGIGDTAAKTMLRRLREMGVIIQVGRSGSILNRELRGVVEKLGLCVSRECIGFDGCMLDSMCVEGLGAILRPRDSLVSLGHEPLLIMCCGGAPTAPGPPPEIVKSYSERCGDCMGSSLCVLYPSPVNPIVDAAILLYGVARVVCED